MHGLVKMQSMVVVCVVAAAVCGVTQARLVFPAGTDLGYILPDDPVPDKFEAEGNWLNDMEEYRAGRLREDAAMDVTDAIRSLVHSVEDKVRDEERSIEEGQQQEQIYEDWPAHGLVRSPKSLSPPADLPENLKDKKHGVAMGIPSYKCDNAKLNLTLDWDFSPVNYTCFDPRKHRIPVSKDLESVLNCVEIAQNYTPEHVCMNQKLTYNTTLPTFGPHRPLWPIFGEYRFVPVQRWLHSLEHGGIVMLYDPCAEPLLVSRLRKILTGCFRKHIITPYNLLTKERPLALVAWGCSLEMATISEEEVKNFIKTRALHGPEGHYPKNGSFKEGLIRKAEYPSAVEKDSVICPE